MRDLSSELARARGWLERSASSRWFGWGCLTVVLLKIFWGIWDRRDFSTGDTISYYSGMARGWHEHFLVVPGWSPLYTAFLGSFLWLNPDPFFAMWVHRVVLIAAAGFLLYEILRRLTTPFLAFVISSWWVLVPTNHNALYEVHPFAILLPLAAMLILCLGDTAWHRGWAIALLLIATVLARPEYLVATVLLMASALLWEGWLKPGSGGFPARARTILVCFGVPLAVAMLINGGFLARSAVSLEEMSHHLHAKQKMNINQLFAFGYSKRNPDWRKDPWTSADELMTQTFGTDDVGLLRAYQINPSAMATHSLWNLHMLPDGIAIALLAAKPGEVNPDYTHNDTRPLFVGFAGLLFAGVTAGGLVALWRDRARVWREWLGTRVWPLLGLGFLSLGSLSILLLAPPRPSFIYGLTVSLMVLIGIGAFGLLRCWTNRDHYRWTVPLLMAGFVVVLPPYWLNKQPNQPIRAQIAALAPFRKEIAEGKIRNIATSSYEDGVRAYMDFDHAERSRFVSAQDIQPKQGQSYSAALGEQRISMIVIADILESDPQIADFEKSAALDGWSKVVDGLFHHHRVRIYRR